MSSHLSAFTAAKSVSFGIRGLFPSGRNRNLFWQGLRRLPREDGSKVKPPKERFTINAIIRDLELPERDWAADLLAGYFCQPLTPWER